jgi:hypothetical protein
MDMTVGIVPAPPLHILSIVTVRLEDTLIPTPPEAGTLEATAGADGGGRPAVRNANLPETGIELALISFINGVKNTLYHALTANAPDTGSNCASLGLPALSWAVPATIVATEALEFRIINDDVLTEVSNNGSLK